MCAAETFAINYPPLLFAQLIRRRVSAAAATGSCLQLYARLIFCHNFAVFAHIAVKSIETNSAAAERHDVEFLYPL